jgi:hypothetical protein
MAVTEQWEKFRREKMPTYFAVARHQDAKNSWPRWQRFLHWALVSWRCPCCMAERSDGYWLPEDHTLRLTALEMGQLLMLIYLSPPGMKVNKPGPSGEPVATFMRSRLLEKIQNAIEERHAANENETTFTVTGHSGTQTFTENKEPEATPEPERKAPG